MVDVWSPEEGIYVATASELPIVDAAANYDATDVEAALAEIWTLLASVANSKGASFIGVEDVAGNLASTNLESALAEIFTRLASGITGDGASLITAEDAAANFTATDVEGILKELYDLIIINFGVTTELYFEGCFAQITTPTVFPAITDTPVIFDGADVYDTDSIHNPAGNSTRFSVPLTKTKMKVTAYIPTDTFTVMTAWLAKNGATSTKELGTLHIIDSATQTSLNYSSGWIAVTPGDYYELILRCTTACNGLATNAYLSVEFQK